ncbi:MAG: hypothetical protein HFH48_01085 [Lachnospiraceae bacterium]|nr:hypothetical protein [Lachnospiraceae bacterium]
MINKINGSFGSEYFTQAVSGYGKNRQKEDEEKKSVAGENTASNKEWDNLLDRVNKSIEDTTAVSDETRKKVMDNIIGERNAPYSILADENGMIDYNGVIFQCDYEKNCICLGDVSNPNNCLSIPLERGGYLMVNRDSIGALGDAIGMFSPEDINRILRAISQDTRLRQVKQEIDDKTSGLEVLKQKEGKEDEFKLYI